jgi:SAM-dependent methyltransferase
MLLNESLYLKTLIDTLEGDANTKVLNFGSQREDTLSTYQPWVNKNIIETTRVKGFTIVNFDIVDGKGVDIAGDLFEEKTFTLLKTHQYSIVFLFNVLEHVTDIPRLCRQIEAILEPGGKILVSVPYRYPKHNDPIDNGFRPTPEEIAGQFPASQLLDYQIVKDKYFSFYMKLNKKRLLKFVIRLFFPFYKYENWKNQFRLLKYLRKNFFVSCALLVKQ